MPQEDAYVEINRSAMEQIWTKVGKTTQDGINYIVYTQDDLPALYESGMMDTRRVSLENFLKFFEPLKQSDKKYWVSKENFIKLGKYRYAGRIKEPFDPIKMRQGRYTVERLWRVFERSIIPSTSLDPRLLKAVFDGLIVNQKSPKEIFAKQLKKLKEQGKEPEVDEAELELLAPLIEEGGKKYVEITERDLKEIQKILDTYPSPQRRLEIDVQNARQERLQGLAQAQENLQKSSFEAGQDFRVKAQKELGDLLVKTEDGLRGGRKPTDEVLDLKELQRKGRKTKF